MIRAVKTKQGHYNINGTDYFFRSTWEANFALYLDFLLRRGEIKKWEYESQTFWFEGIKRGTNSYKPDFKVTENNNTITYYEVKGWLDPKSKTKLKRMKKYFPNIKLILVDKAFYNDIRYKMGSMLSFFV